MNLSDFQFLLSHLSCPVCGGSFPLGFPNGTLRYSSHGVPKYCSKTCKGKARYAVLYNEKGFGVHKGQARPAIRGENHPKWKGGISPERQSAMTRVEYRAWRSAVYERDDYTCRTCGRKGVRLNAHHVCKYSESEEKRYDVENGLTLCVPCHSIAHALLG